MIKIFLGKGKTPEGDGHYLNVEEEMNAWERDNIYNIKVLNEEVMIDGDGGMVGYIYFMEVIK